MTTIADITNWVMRLVCNKQQSIFDDVIKSLKWRHQSTSLVNETYFGKIQGLIIHLTWETKKF